LKDCRETMQVAGVSAELETGTKIFCKPGHYEAARKALESIEDSLRPYHVIVTAEFRPLVLQVVKSFPRALKVKCKEECVIAHIGHNGSWVAVPAGLASVEKEAKEQPEKAEAKAAKPASPKEEGKTSKQRKSKGAKGNHSVLEPVEDVAHGSNSDHALLLDTLVPPFPLGGVPPLDPLAFSMLAPPPVENDPSFMQFVQVLEQQQAMFNQALMFNLHAQRIIQDSQLFAAELDHQLSGNA